MSVAIRFQILFKGNSDLQSSNHSSLSARKLSSLWVWMHVLDSHFFSALGWAPTHLEPQSGGSLGPHPPLPVMPDLLAPMSPLFVLFIFLGCKNSPLPWLLKRGGFPHCS